MPPKRKAKGLKAALKTHLHQKQQVDKAIRQVQIFEKAEARRKQQARVKGLTIAARRSGRHYPSGSQTLLVGEGNFSFASALATKWGDAATLIATAFDPQAVCAGKYADSAAHTANVVARGGQVLYGVDATQLADDKRFVPQTFDIVAFHFPHVGLGIKDQDRNVAANQALLTGFFHAAKPLLKRPASGQGSRYAEWGAIHVTLKTGMPYELWNVKRLAFYAGLRVLEAFPFDAARWPGYTHRRTLGFKPGLSVDANAEILKRECKTYVFVPIECQVILKKPGSKKPYEADGSDDDHDDNDDLSGAGQAALLAADIEALQQQEPVFDSDDESALTAQQLLDAEDPDSASDSDHHKDGGAESGSEQDDDDDDGDDDDEDDEEAEEEETPEPVKAPFLRKRPQAAAKRQRCR